MQILLVIAALAFTAHGLSDSNLTCTESTLALTGSAADYPGFDGPQIIVAATCNLDASYGLAATAFDTCGATRSVVDKMIKYTGTITSPAPTGLITRKKVVSYSFECTFDTETGKSAGAHIKPIVPTVTGDLVQKGGAVTMGLYLMDEDGDLIGSGSSLKVKVGVVVNAVVSGTSLAGTGLVARATKCYVTPDPVPGATRYVLMNNGCAEDSTWSSSTAGTDQNLSFQALAFTKTPSAAVYFHCDLAACNAADKCGECAPDARRRRSVSAAYTYRATQMISPL